MFETFVVYIEGGEMRKVSATAHAGAARVALGSMPLPAGGNATGRVRYYRTRDGKDVTVARSHTNIF